MAKHTSQHGGKRPGAGRPPKPDDERRDQVFSVKLTLDEKRLLEETEARAWARDILLRTVQKALAERGGIEPNRHEPTPRSVYKTLARSQDAGHFPYQDVGLSCDAMHDARTLTRTASQWFGSDGREMSKSKQQPKSGQSPRTINPYATFHQARCYLEAARLLTQNIDAGGVFGLLPATSNAAFGLELLFKCLHETRGRERRGHLLRDLFDVLGVDDRRNIERYFDESNRSNSTLQCQLALVQAHHQITIRMDLKSALTCCDDLFYKNRYLHERIQLDTDQDGIFGSFGLQGLIEAVLRILNEEHPDWERDFASQAWRQPLAPNSIFPHIVPQ